MRRATSKNPSFPRISKKCILTLNSYAKLNLYLEVLKKRPDKYHDLNTLFERITLCDRISLKPLEDSLIRVYCTDKQLQENPRKNLAYLSAMLLRKRFRIKNGVEIRIEKNIPVGSGMGGGSSNAATVLLGLNMLWGLGLTKYELAAIGAKIGSDVPFFIYDVPFALGKGRGERIQPLKRLSNMRLWHILVVPRL
ncbi:MAG: 4-(cytidine 5'-diphospho)-2-C-methyl-D-erythritol kinase, partial [Candidatus Omnitrophica bacterium]|nr:4-(cytidine 5'-diphospho)-2-C-methyl-D-erythritol kinase [Candidatus Omnitrophota bacterium]